MSPTERRLTVPELVAMKPAGRKIAMLTAYDYPTARIVDEAGIDVVLVGDSLGMVIQGQQTTLAVTLDEMVYHATLVGRAVRRALVVVDLPFPTFQLGPVRAIEAAARLIKESQCQAVKLEGGRDQAQTIAALCGAGIPVMAHCGLQPQSIHQLGRFGVQRDRQRLLADAQAAQEAGAFAIVLEYVPAGLAAEISATLSIPTIGIGAGNGCDGQVLVLHDLLGLTADRVPRHARAYADLKSVITQAVGDYARDVRSGAFPGADQSFE